MGGEKVLIVPETSPAISGDAHPEIVKENHEFRACMCFLAFLVGLLMIAVSLSPNFGEGVARIGIRHVFASFGAGAGFFALSCICLSGRDWSGVPIGMASLGLCAVCVVVSVAIAAALTVGLLPFGCLVAALALLGTLCQMG